MDLPITLSSLRVLAQAASNVAPGDWWTDKEANDADPKYDVPVLFAGDKRLLDAHSSDIVLLREDFTGDEGGEWREIWDENSSVLFQYLAAANPQTMLALLTRLAALEADKRRLDFFDEANQRLNARYGTTYRWKVVINHNVNRLLLGQVGEGVDLEDSQPNGHRSCRLAIDEAMREAGRATWDGPLLDDLRPMAKAKKNGKPILARFKAEIPDRPDQSGIAGLWVVIRHPGLAADGFDAGWSLAGPFGHGGLPDSWFEGWALLPGDASHPTAQSAPT